MKKNKDCKASKSKSLRHHNSSINRLEVRKYISHTGLHTPSASYVRVMCH